MLGQNAKATLLATEQFNYSVAGTLGSTAPLGSANWSGNNGVIAVTNAAALTAPSGLVAAAFSGCAVTNNSGSLKFTGYTNFTGVATTAGNVFYASFLLNVRTLPSTSGNIILGFHNALKGDTQNKLNINLSSTGQLGIQKLAAGVVNVSGTPFSTPGTHFVVARYTYSGVTGGDEVALWVDPGSYGAGSAPTPGVATTSGANAGVVFSFVNVVAQATASFGNASYWIDEIRLGTTWADVAPSSGVCNTATVTAPANASVVTGMPATFTISAGTSSSPTYQWQKSTAAAGGTYTNIPSANFASYTNLVTTAGDNGFNYRCVVSVACDSSTATSAAAMLTTSCTTVGISSQPSGASVFAGQTANFSLTATGSTPTYQWQFSTDSGASWSPAATGTGTNAASYTTAATTTGQDGYQYRCVVNVACDGSSVTSSVVTLSVTCNTAGIAAGPVNVTAIAGSTAVFTVAAIGSSPTYQWQLSTDGGTSWNPVGTSTNVYTTLATSLPDIGKQYRCIVSVACDSSSVTSAVATLGVVDPATISFRSAASGSWQSIATWQLSADNGASWLAASATPTAANSTNILISASTTVTNLATVSADQIVVAAGGTLVVSNTLTVASSGSAVDLDVQGTVLGLGGSSTLTLASGVGMVVESGGVFAYDGTSGSGSVSSSGATITIASGGKFQLRRAGGTVPVLTWNTGSTCEIAYSTASNSKPNGISQTFANFTWNNPLQNGSVDLAGTLTNINGNFLLTAANGQEIKWSGDANFGGNLTINDGSLNVSGNATPRVWTLTGDLTIGASGTFTVTATANALSQIILNGTGTQNYTCSGVNSATKLFWTVNSGSILNLNNDLAITTTGRALTNNGTVNLNGKNLLTDLVSGTGTVRNQGGGSGKLVIGVGNSTNTLDGTLALLDGASGTLSLVKGGNSGTAGLLNITTPNTFSGGLVVSNGLCFVNNSTGSGTGSGGISVINGTLGGTGAVTGPVTFTGGKLSPGVDGVSIGTFTVNGTLTLVGNTTMDVNKGVGQDQVVATTVNYSGLLTIVTNGSAFVAGDTFNLFTAGSHTANFGSITNNPGDGLAWAFNPTNGVLSVILSAPPVLGTSLSGGVLTFTWTASGFKLQSQTNNLTTGLGTNWFDYPGGGTSPVGVTIDPASPSVFFRLSQ